MGKDSGNDPDLYFTEHRGLTDLGGRRSLVIRRLDPVDTALCAVQFCRSPFLNSGQRGGYTEIGSRELLAH